MQEMQEIFGISHIKKREIAKIYHFSHDFLRLLQLSFLTVYLISLFIKILVPLDKV